MSLVLVVGSASTSFAANGMQDSINQMSASEWVVILLGMATITFFLIFLVLSLVFYTVIVTKKSQHGNMNA